MIGRQDYLVNVSRILVSNKRKGRGNAAEVCCTISGGYISVQRICKDKFLIINSEPRHTTQFVHMHLWCYFVQRRSISGTNLFIDVASNSYWCSTGYPSM